MTDLFLNLGIGIVGGIIASVLTLIGDRWLHRSSVERRLRLIEGNYTITDNSAKRDTSKERITINHVDGRRFEIIASGGPTGNWTGFFIVREDFFDIAHGIYRYNDSSDWGQHEYLLDPTSARIFIYGINRSRPGLIEPYSLTLERVHPGALPNNTLQPTACGGG